MTLAVGSITVFLSPLPTNPAASHFPVRPQEMLSLLRESLAAFSLLRDEIRNVISESKTAEARYSRFPTQ